jgi:hypothetical protein
LGINVGSFTANGQSEFTLPDDGRYVALFHANDLRGTGSYEFELQCHPPEPVTPSPPVVDFFVQPEQVETNIATYFISGRLKPGFHATINQMSVVPDLAGNFAKPIGVWLDYIAMLAGIIEA